MTLRSNRRLRGFTESIEEIGYQGIRRGDLVIHGMDAFAGAIGVADSDGKGSPVYSICEARAGVYPDYYAFTLREMARNGWIQALAKGIRERSTDFRYESFASQLLPLPPEAEQVAMVRYLIYVDGRIERYVRAKQKLIVSLQEQKRALIREAVTRGIEPRAPLKLSGVEWLGEVPEHWEVRRLKNVFLRIVGGSTPASAERDYWGGDVVWVTPADVSRSARLRTSLRHITLEGLKSCSAALVPPGSVVVTSRAPVGNVALTEVELCTNQGCKALVPNYEALIPMFGFHVLATLKGELQSLATGTTFMELSTNRLGAVAMPLPPLSEQVTITRHLAAATADFEAAIDRAKQAIDILREYRSRLIADVVTGQLDVREAAARLPDDIAHVEPFHETGPLDDSEEELPDDVVATGEEATA